MKKIQSIYHELTYWIGIIAVGLIFGLTIQFTIAWVNPPSTPPAGNVGAPINTGNSGQSKLGNLALNTSGSWQNALLIPNGNVGIGTNTPKGMLSFQSPLANRGYIDIFDPAPGTAVDIDFDGGSDSLFGFWNKGANTGGTFFESNASFWPNVILYMSNNGNVGIGTSSPGAKLTVTKGRFWLGNSDGTNNFEIYNDAASGAGNASLRFVSGTSNLVEIDKNGNVGIGTNNPGAKLDVVKGNIRTSDGYIYAYTNGSSNYGLLNYAGYGGYFSGSGGVYAQNTSGYYSYLDYPGTSYSFYGNGNGYFGGDVCNGSGRCLNNVGGGGGDTTPSGAWCGIRSNADGQLVTCQGQDPSGGCPGGYRREFISSINGYVCIKN